MPRVITDEAADRIRLAGPDVSTAALAEELGLHRNTVRKYREEARQDRREATRQVIAEHAREHAATALSDLTELRQVARAQYLNGADPKTGQVWLGAIREELKHAVGAKPEREFNDYTDDELRDLVRQLVP